MDSNFKVEMDIKGLKMFFQLLPKETPRAVASMLNAQAFEYRRVAPEVLAQRYTIRNKSFVESRMRVEKAQASQSIGSQVARAGSIKSDRFTGWIEEVTRQDPERERSIGPNARKGNMENRAEQSNRLMPGTAFPRPSNFSNIPSSVRIPAMLAILAREPGRLSASKGAFILEGGSWTPGLYKFKPGQAARIRNSKKKGQSIIDKRDSTAKRNPDIVQVQDFTMDPKAKPFDWPNLTIKKIMDGIDVGAMWRHHLDDVIRRSKAYK